LGAKATALWGVHRFFVEEESIQFEFDGPTSLLATDEAIVQIHLAPDQPLGPLRENNLYRATTEGFATAGEADAMGVKPLIVTLVVRDYEGFWCSIGLPFTSPMHCL